MKKQKKYDNYPNGEETANLSFQDIKHLHNQIS